MNLGRYAIALSLILGLLPSPARAADRLTVTNYGVIVETLPWAIALERGFFKKEGLDIDGFVGSNGGGTTIRNMMANSLPFAEVALPAVVAGIDAGLDLKIVYGGVNNLGDLAWVVKQDSPLKTIRDLKGKKAAFSSPRSTTEMVLRMALESAKLDKDVETVAAGGIGAGMTALDTGAVDAAPFEEPELLPPGKYRVLFRITDFLPDVTWQVGVTTAEFARAHPDVVRKLVAARRDALQYMIAHPDDAAKVYAKVWNTNDKRFADVIARLIKIKYWATDGFNVKGLDTMARGMALVGAVDHPVDVNALIDKSFLPKARDSRDDHPREDRTGSRADRGGAVVRARCPQRDQAARDDVRRRDEPALCPGRGRRNGVDAISPRHKHTFDQVRYYIDGDAKFGREIYKPGDCVYFPEGVPYGPQIGHGDRDSLHVTLQFGGASGIYFPSHEEQYAAREELSKSGGTFTDGIYTGPDGRKRDGFEAIVERLTGKPPAYAKPRFEGPVRMRTAAFPAIPMEGNPSVAVRRLASFTESGPDIKLVQIEAGARLGAGTSRGDQVRLLLSGDLRYGDTELDGISTMYVPRDDVYPASEALTACTILVTQFGFRPASFAVL